MSDDEPAKRSRKRPAEPPAPAARAPGDESEHEPAAEARGEEQVTKLPRQRTLVNNPRQGYKIVEDRNTWSMVIAFEQKPDQATLDLVKQHGFKWSPERKAWTQYLNHEARVAAEKLDHRLSAGHAQAEGMGV
jgi:hypothetical protein